MMAAQIVRAVMLVSIKRERTDNPYPLGISNSLVTPMDEGQVKNPIDAAAEITDAPMMSSLADVVKNVISTPEEGAQSDVKIEGSDEENDVEQVSEDVKIDTTVDDLVSEGEATHRSGDHDSALKAFNKAIAMDPSNSMRNGLTEVFYCKQNKMQKVLDKHSLYVSIGAKSWTSIGKPCCAIRQVR